MQHHATDNNPINQVATPEVKDRIFQRFMAEHYWLDRFVKDVFPEYEYSFLEQVGTTARMARFDEKTGYQEAYDTIMNTVHQIQIMVWQSEQAQSDVLAKVSIINLVDIAELLQWMNAYGPRPVENKVD